MKIKLPEVLWLLAGAGVPLLLNPWGYNAFELPKARLLQALALAMLPAALSVAPAYWRKPTGWKAPSIWIVVLIMATITSVAPQMSLWGAYQRQQGLLTQLAGIIFFFAVAAGLSTRAEVDRLWNTLIWSSLPIMVYGLIQIAGYDPRIWQHDSTISVLGTLGRSNFLGSYLVLILPLTAGRLAISRRPAPLIGLLAVQIVTLLLTGARAAWLGSLAAGLTFVALWAQARQDHKLLKTVGIIALLVTLALIAVNWPGSPIASLPGLERLAFLNPAVNNSTAARLTMWKAALPLIGERPWIGYGPETLRQIFARNFPPALIYYQGREVAVDRVHNAVLDLLLSTGIAGLTVWIALIGTTARRIQQGLRKAFDSETAIIWAMLGAALVGHGVDLLFGFETTSGQLLLWLLLGWSMALEQGFVAKKKLEPGPPLWQTAAPAVVVLALTAQSCLRPLWADMIFRQAQESRPPPVDKMQRVVALWPQEPEYRLNYAQSLAWNGMPQAAVAEWQATRRWRGADPWFIAAGAGIYTTLGENAEAEKLYREAISLAPNVADFHLRLGKFLAAQKRWNPAREALECAVDLDATYGDAYQELVKVYQALNLPQQTAWAQQQAERWHNRK